MGEGGLTSPFVPSEVEGQVTGASQGVGRAPLVVGTHSVLAPVLIAWLLAALVLTLVAAGDILTLHFPDPDDAMRLMEVRDWLAGQSWWDVTQYRLNNGNFPMHWSRLVDLPLAAVLAVARPLVGDPVATRLAMVVVPLLSLLAAMAAVGQITRRIADAEAVRWAVLLAPLSMPFIYQLRPMRIDHHGWQIVFALAATACLMQRPIIRSGVLAGAALAMLLSISLEGMPFAVSIVGVAALAWAWDVERRGFLLALLWSLSASVTALHLATRGPAFFVPACDAIAPVWIATLGVAAATVTIATRLGGATMPARIALLGIAGAATGAVWIVWSPECLAGPFATLPPIAYRNWYLNVLEGRPLWEQPFDRGFITVALPIVGLFATMRAWWLADYARKLPWAMLFALLAAALLTALFVNRAGATANALALPAAATLLAALLARARQVSPPWKRLIATAAAFLVVSPGYLAVIGKAIGARLCAVQITDPERDAGRRQPCQQVDNIRVIGRLPVGLVYSPLDLGPDIIATTGHRGMAGGYHRSAELIGSVLATFAGSPEQARIRIVASGADYLAGCPGLSETDLYRRRFPEGFWARLERGERFNWLQPIPTGTPALAWRVIRPLPSPNPRP